MRKTFKTKDGKEITLDVPASSLGFKCSDFDGTCNGCGRFGTIDGHCCYSCGFLVEDSYKQYWEKYVVQPGLVAVDESLPKLSYVG